MPQQIIEIAGIGQVVVNRDRRSKRIKLKINHDDRPEVTAPNFVPIITIKRFVQSKADWVKAHQGHKKPLTESSIIGFGGEIHVGFGSRLATKISPDSIKLTMPFGTQISEPEVQDRLQTAAIKMLRLQAQSRFPELVEAWSLNGVGTYKTVSIKLIKSRWGSYSSDGKISLSLFMSQLPSHLIDYIIVHELSHSVHMNHSKDFWSNVAEFMPDYRDRRKELKKYSMRVNAK